MTHEITADWVTLLSQAVGTADGYLADAVARIDNQFGDGFAAAHPELIVGFMQAAAIDFHATSVGIAAQKIAEAIQRSGEMIGGSIHDAVWEFRRDREAGQ